MTTTMMIDEGHESHWQNRFMTAGETSAESRPGEQWSMLVHDLRNPLATVKGYAELLRRRAAERQLQTADIAESARHIQDAVKTIEGLVDQFSAGPQTRSPGATDLIEVARHVAGQIQPGANGSQRNTVLSGTH